MDAMVFLPCCTATSVRQLFAVQVSCTKLAYAVVVSRSLSSLSMRNSREAHRVREQHGQYPGTTEVQALVPENSKYTKQIVAHGRQGRWHEVMAVWDSISTKNTIVYNALLSAADRCGRHEEGLRFFAEMRESQLQLTGISYGAALTLLGRLGRHAEARQLWGELGTSGAAATPACLTGLLNAAAVNGSVALVEEDLSAAESAGWRLSTPQLGCLVRAAREAGDPDRALAAIRETRARGLQPSVVMYTLAMGAFSRSAKHEGSGASLKRGELYASTLAREMSADCVKADAYFVEEHLRVLLGADLAGSIDATADARTAALTMLDESVRAGIRRTNLVVRVEDRLRQEMVSPLPAGWGQAVDPASQRPYYWREDDPSRLATWERPR